MKSVNVFKIDTKNLRLYELIRTKGKEKYKLCQQRKIVLNILHKLLFFFCSQY